MGKQDERLVLPLDNTMTVADNVICFKGRAVFLRADILEQPVRLQHCFLNKSAEKEEFLPPEIYDRGLRLCK